MPVGQPVEEPLPERALVGEHRVPADRVDVVERGDEPGEQLVLARPELVAVADGLVGGRAAPCTGATTPISSFFPNAMPMCGP